MFWLNLLFVFLFALVFSSILGWGLGWRHPARADAAGVSILFLFVILLVVMWAGAAWLPPLGPAFYGTSWLTILIVGLVVSLLVLAVSMPVRRRTIPRETEIKAEQEAAAFGVFFWVLILGLLILGIAAYWG